jgi:hypothetical protein
MHAAMKARALEVDRKPCMLGCRESRRALLGEQDSDNAGRLATRSLADERGQQTRHQVRVPQPCKGGVTKPVVIPMQTSCRYVPMSLPTRACIFETDGPGMTDGLQFS